MRNMDAFAAVDRKKGLAFGVDLGTTNSCIAVVGNGTTPEMVDLGEAKHIMPSCVMWMGGESFVVGEEAYHKRDRENVVYSVKRLMGSGERIPLVFEGERREFEPWEISREVLKALVDKARGGIYKDISDVVITVPAYFSNTQIADTLKAGHAAGLNVLQTFKEPSAAALRYNQQVPDGQNKKVLLYDLGGGTFDVSVILISNSADTELDDIYGLDSGESTTLFSVLKVAGDMRLGGDDVDSFVYNAVVSRMIKQGIVEEDITTTVREGLLLRIEIAKKAGLGRYTDTMQINGREIKFVIEVQDFVDAFYHVFLKTKALLDEVVSDPLVGHIDQIITVGGTTKSNLIQTWLREAFPGTHINASLDPDESVALGSAIQAKRLKFGEESINILDCLALDIGLVCEGFVDPLLRAGMQIPCKVSRMFSTDHPGQDVVDLAVFQGNSRYIEECEYLGNLVIEGVSSGSDMLSKVLVELGIDSNGLLMVSARAGNAGLKRHELVNILGAKKVVEPVTDKRVIRWRSFAGRLGLADKGTLLALIDSFLEGEVSEETVTSFIKERKSVKEISTELRIVTEVI